MREWVFGTWVMAVWLWAGCAVAGLPDTVEQVRPSVVAVGTYEPLRNPRAQFLGTGFAVGDGRLVVTNAHVVPEKLDQQRNETLEVYSGRGSTKINRHQAEVVALDKRHDLAVLAVSGKPLPPLKLGSSQGVREGEEIALTGFPIGMVLGLYPVTHRGIVAAISPIAIPAINDRQLTADVIRARRNPYDVLQLDATAYPGNSGSPLYRPGDGVVIGVINSVLVKNTKESALSRPTGITYAIPVRFVKALLKRAKR